MKCPSCQNDIDVGDSRVKDSRPSANYVWRRRVCKHCKTGFTTHEIPLDYDLVEKIGMATRKMKKRLSQLNRLIGEINPHGVLRRKLSLGDDAQWLEKVDG